MLDRLRANEVALQAGAERQLAVPRWSPDGKQVGFIGGLMSDEGFLGGDIFAAPGKGRRGAQSDAEQDGSPNGFRWQSDTKWFSRRPWMAAARSPRWT